MKKSFLSIYTCLLISTSLFSAEHVKGKVDLSYDVSKGWWWYEETYTDPNTNKEEKIAYSMTPKEKQELDQKKETNDLLKKIAQDNEENKKLNQAILERLNYAFPEVTPIYTTNKKTGEKCVTNSSMDCFVMPVIAEGQQIPVLKEFLRNPSPDNSKSWLQWQATYFNHVQKVSHGLRFAFLKNGAEAYPTTTSFSYGDNPSSSEAENALGVRQAKIITSMKDNLALLVFVGKNRLFEKNNKIEYEIHNWNKTYLKDIDKIFIFESDTQRDNFLTDIQKNYSGNNLDKDVLEFWKNAKVTVRKDLFEQYNIAMTPSTVLFYENKENKKNIAQVVLSGTLSSESLRSQITNFLTYNEIVSEKEFSADKNWNTSDSNKEIKKVYPKPDNSKIYPDSYEGNKNEKNN